MSERKQLPGGLPARRAALAALAQMLEKGATLDDAAAQAFKDLEPRDRAFARALVTATLRRLGEIDQLLAGYLTKPMEGSALPIQHVLRLGVAQLLYLDVPQHAVLDTANRLVIGLRNQRLKGLRGLVNAVLRRITREKPHALSGAEAGRANTPDWLLKAWEADYGAETAAAIAAAHLQIPAIDITLKPGADTASWAERLEAEILPTGSLRRESDGLITELTGFKGGLWWVQDAAAALPVRLMADIAGKTAIDLCAAPGGKTLQLAAAGAQVTAVDRSAPRLARVEENLKRTGLTANLVAADAKTWQPEAPVDIVLLDAPCSATGTLRRHPDLPHIKNADHLGELVPLQAELLDKAARMVAPGSMLIYCVCSLSKAEGEAQVAAFLERNTAFARREIGADEAPGLDSARTAEGDLRILPCHWPERGGIDGFFISRLVRRN